MTFTTAAFDRSSSWRFEALPTGRLRRVLLHLSYSMALSRLLDTTPPSHPALPSGGPPRHPGRAPRRSRAPPCRRSVPCPLPPITNKEVWQIGRPGSKGQPLCVILKII